MHGDLQAIGTSGRMTIEAVGREPTRTRRRKSAPLPIGEADANIFNCPSCARPLAVGTSRCPGCSTRLIAGIRASRVFGFVAAGLVVGVMVGSGVVAAFFLTMTPARVAANDAAVVTPSAAPAATALATSLPAPAAAGPVPDPGIPASALSALDRSAVLNQRLADDAASLTKALAVATPSSIDIARTLRSMAATAAFGDRIAPEVARWGAGVAVSGRLEAFYAAIGGTAREGLAASLRNSRAYIDAGRAMLAVMAILPDVDAASRTLAAAADQELPPLVLAPGSSGS